MVWPDARPSMPDRESDRVFREWHSQARRVQRRLRLFGRARALSRAAAVVAPLIPNVQPSAEQPEGLLMSTDVTLIATEAYFSIIAFGNAIAMIAAAGMLAGSIAVITWGSSR